MKKTIISLAAIVITLSLIGVTTSHASSCCACAMSEVYVEIGEGDELHIVLPEVNWPDGPRGVADKPQVTRFSQTFSLGDMEVFTFATGQRILYLGKSYYLFVMPDAIYMVRYLGPVSNRGRGTGLLTSQEPPEKVLKEAIEMTGWTFRYVKTMFIYEDPYWDPNKVDKVLGIPVSGGYMYGNAAISAGKSTSREEQVTNVLGHAFKLLIAGNCTVPGAAAILDRIGERAAEIQRCHDLGENNAQLRKEQGMDFARLAMIYYDFGQDYKMAAAIDAAFLQFKQASKNLSQNYYDPEIYLFLAYTCLMRGDQDSARANIARGGRNWSFNQLDEWAQARLSGSVLPMFAVPAEVEQPKTRKQGPVDEEKERLKESIKKMIND